MIRLPFLLMVFLLAGDVQGMSWNELAWFSTDAHWPGNSYGSDWDEGRQIEGRAHVNGALELSSWDYRHFPAVFSQTGEWIIGLMPGEFEQVFPEGLLLNYVEAEWPPELDLDALHVATSMQHRWPGEADGSSLTTLLRFDGATYHAAQYAESHITDGDTLWHLPWMVLPMPQPPGEDPLIWIEGVGRIKGIVEGAVTLMCSDSLFLMGDLITADADTLSLPWSNQYGTVPEESGNYIGVIAETNLIVAATLENGFANGAENPGLDCGLASSPVLVGQNQSRSDILLTADMLALGCSFMVEWWKTTAWALEVPPAPVAHQAAECGDSLFTELQVWEADGEEGLVCTGTDSRRDQRGAIRIRGSLAQGREGFTWISLYEGTPPVRIGYTHVQFRPRGPSTNGAPPYWPDMVWQGDNLNPFDLELTVLSEVDTDCGVIADTSSFLDGWSDGTLQLEVSHAWPDELPIPLHLNLLVDGEPREQASIWLPPVVERMALPFDPGAYLTEGSTLWISAECESFVWNENGEECSWLIDANTELTFAKHPAGFTLHPPFPNPFNPVTQVELELPAPSEVRVTVHDLTGRLMSVIHDGFSPVGVTAFSVDGSSWPSGMYVLLAEGIGVHEVRKLVLLK